MRTTSKVFNSVLIASLLAASSFAAAQGVIQQVSVSNSSTSLDVTVLGEGLSTPTVSRANRGSVYIASFRGVLKGRAGSQRVDAHGVSRVQWVQFTNRPAVARVVLRLRPTDMPAVTRIDGGFRITVGTGAQMSAGDFATQPESQSQVQAVGAPATNHLPSVAAPANRSGARPVVLSGGATRPSNPLIAEIIPGMQGRLITLEFDDADVTQILKALAMQAGVNVVTAPEIKGNLTIKLDRVSVEHALNVITAMAGLRYQQVDRTIVVAPPNRIVDILRGINAREPEAVGPTETRVIPIFSRQGRQLKSAAYRMVPQAVRSGRYEIVLPSEEVSASPLAGPAPVAATTSPTPAPAAEGGGARESADDYVMVIGHRARLDEVEKVIRELDAQLCVALGIEVPSSTAIVQKTYNVRGTTADALLTAMGAKNGKVGSVDAAATPAGSKSPQAIVLSGREHEVRRLMMALGELDSEGTATDELVIYEIAFSEPRSLRDELLVQVPGVRASIAPASVGNPRLYSSRGATLQVGGTAATPMAQQAQATGAAQGGGGGAGSTDGIVGEGRGFDGGLSQPFKAVEPVAQPMRLILRGSKEQVARAQSVLAKMDVPPRMVALEVRVMELSRDDAVNLGIDWNIFTGGAVKFIRLRNTVDNANNSVGVGIDDRNFTGDVVGTLDRIANRNNLIARPNMIAPDGRESELFIGDALRYVETIIASQTGPSVQIGTVRVGINLSVLPRISADGNMTLDLRPVVSFLTGFKRVSVQGFVAELPQTSERITQQTIPLRSGETFAISGLIQSQDVKQLSGVPILMDLPIIGALFRRTTTQTVRRELVVFVTARAITGPLSANNSELPLAPSSETSKPENQR